MKHADRSLYMNRPRWASRLSFEQWEGLKDCQSCNSGQAPTLARLKRDREYQRAAEPRRGILCYDCKSCAYAIGLEDSAGRPLDPIRKETI